MPLTSKIRRVLSAEGWLLLRAAALLAVAQMAVRWMPFRWAVRAFGFRRRVPPTGFSVDQIIRAVDIAGRFVTGRCLAKSLTVRKLLAENGHASELWIGVRPGGPFEGHAWVEHEGRIRYGGPVADGFVPLLVLGPAAR